MPTNNDEMEMATADGASNESGTSVPHMSLRVRPRKRERRVQLLQPEEFHFLDDFDPEKSNRERRKMSRKLTTQARTIYNEYGHIRKNNVDVCDCMDESCPGCWYECENCNSTKCGLQCRVNRKFFFEAITFDGKDGHIINPYAIISKPNK